MPAVRAWLLLLLLSPALAADERGLRGYDTVPAILPDTPMPPYRPSPLEVRDIVRTTLAGIGLSEVVTFALKTTWIVLKGR